ncbi:MULTISPECIES: SCO family protein [Mesonia]|uniref:SCO1 protein n=1 Tax=Mesonia oceanica TaxID=2687242 RepID=A0AC61Y984_9FLAO|nr:MULTISPECIES: SCO family protein [Mesonia]MAN27412.1 SCO family protein [Mesonia sp.]MAQ40313.1 SCO family protein [Mesonia sp.]MBJ97224.1 SCO family protein [Flavobacteriaceae bacterium]VVV00745.1 SCO1 protein [Mesonia oceanica]
MKRKYSYIGLAVIILVFGVIVIPKIIERTVGNEVIENDRLNNNPDIHQKELAYIILDGEKAKVPDFEFTNQKGDPISNKDLQGKVYVVDFFFTTCPTICPKMTSNLKDVEKNFRANPNFAIASFSINPENDSPEILKEYAREYGIKNPNWYFLTGEREKIYELANKGFNLYVAENPEVAGNFQHSGYFALVDQEGYLRSRLDKYGNPIIAYNGLEEDDLKMLREDINKLL